MTAWVVLLVIIGLAIALSYIFMVLWCAAYDPYELSRRLVDREEKQLWKRVEE